uniref:DUF4283 domain-containing protein n=1 Tax=Quercus lobata TaxID=97700 RepID=A0A7N2LPL5_QUELO
MADDVINILENMKLTTEEEEIISVLDEGRKEKIESCSQSLIGKFLMCRSFNKRVAQGTLKRTWGMENQVQVVEVGPNLFQFKFNLEFDMARVLRGEHGTLTIRFYPTKNGKEAECQYGEWMKATGTRACSPSSRGRYQGEANHGTKERTVRS